MKKIIYSILVLGISCSTIAQEAAEKKTQAGLVVGSGLAFQKMGTKYLSNNGGNDLTVGANVNFSFTETIGLCTGLEFDFETLKYKASGYLGSNVYYYFNDTEILEIRNVDILNATPQPYQLKERTQKVVYLTIPTMLTFRTKFFGYMRYFGKFGLRNSFLLTSKSSDKGYLLTNIETPSTSVPLDNNNMKFKNEMVFFKSAFGLCGGAEWNFSGSTSLVAEIGYYYGFTSLYWDKGDGKTSLVSDVIKDDGSVERVNYSNDATQSQLMLKVSILF
jgi:hypothetical protein